MDQFNSIFQPYPQYRIVVCRQCCTGIVRSQTQAHLNTKHQYLPMSVRKDIVSAASRVREWANTEEEVVFPDPGNKPIHYLAIFKDGFKCIAPGQESASCRYIRRTVQDMQKHCRKEHGWANPRKRGRVSSGRRIEMGKLWVEGVHCQKFQSTGKLGRLFEVSVQEGDGVGAEENEDKIIQAALEDTFTQATAGLDQAEKNAYDKIQADTNRFEANPWLNRTGWAKHLKGLDREWLVTLIRKPEKNERALRKLCQAVEMVIWKAQQASRASIVGRAAMNYINRREMGNNTNEKPFNASQTGKTMIKYSGWWIAIVRYIWRTHELDVVSQIEEGRAGISRDESEGEEESVWERRPPYRLTGKQAVALKKIQLALAQDKEDDFSELDSEKSEDDSMDEQQEQKLEELALSFMMVLLDHQLRDDEYASVLISGMAVLGIDYQRGWMNPLGYTPKIAAIVNVARMLVLYQATKMRREEIVRLREEEGWGQQDAEDMAPGHFDFVEEMANRFMTLVSYGGRPCPVDWLQRLKAYGMKIRYTTNAEGVIEWVDDTLLYGNIQFSIPQLRSMMHGLVETTRVELRRDLLLLDMDDEGNIVAGSTQIPTIDWTHLVDNPAERRVGWSFVRDPRNEALGLKGGKGWLSRRIINEKLVREAFIDVGATNTTVAGGRGVVWRGDRIRRYGQAMQLFRQHLLALVHMTGGLPPRGTELVTVQYKNSANGDSRGIFIENGLVAYMTAYHKNIGSSGNSKIIHRYLPREVGELMVYYLWLVLPFWESVQSAFCGTPVTSSAFIWEPEEEVAWAKPQRKRRRLEGEREHSQMRDAEDEVGEGEVGHDEESGSSRPPGQAAMHVVEKWNSNRVKMAIQRASLQWMGVKLNIMGWRHGTKAMYRRYIDDKAIVKAVVHGDEDESNDEDEAFDVQTGHGSNVGGMIYGRSITESIFSTEAKRASLRRVSTEWHRFLQFRSALETQPKRGTRAAADRKEAVDEEYQRWKRMLLVNIDEQLKELVGGEAQFRSVQRPAMHAIMRQKSPVVAIMGTGAGKSVLFMLPASCSTGVTVVIVPLVSLRQDMKTRCDRAGIECVEWDSRRPHEWAQVVLVTPEAAVGEAFGNFINRQRSMGRLDRIVVDECHVVLDSTEGWRSRMLGLRDLVRAETQLVYLTATMRPSEEGEFLRLMGLPGKERCQWFRGTTTRKNIQYGVQMYEMEKEEEAVAELVARLKQKYAMPGQIIVYCDTVAKTVQLAKVLGGVCFHRNVGSSKEKSELVRQLTEGQQQVFTATNALGLGVDAPTIRAVVHVGMVRKMRHYAQESGRAGRDGLASEAIIMRGFRTDRRGRVRVQGFGKHVEEEMQRFIGGEECMRVVMDQAMDGRENRVQCEDGEERCQHCQRVSTISDGEGEEGVEEQETCGSPDAQNEEAGRIEFEQQLSSRKARAVCLAGSQSREALEVERLRELMEEWKVGCQRCRAFGEDGEGHDIWDCRGKGAEAIRRGATLFKEKVQWARFSGCFECGLPQEICSRFEANIGQGGWRIRVDGRCQYAGVLVGAVFSVWTRFQQAFGDFIEEEMEQSGWVERTEKEKEIGPGIEDIIKWFGKKVRWGGIESNQMCLGFYKFIKEVDSY